MGHLDRCRRPGFGARPPLAGPNAKEWHHIVVHTDELHLLINLSESETPHGSVARTIVMAHTDRWHNSVITADHHDVAISTSRLDARYGSSTHFWFDGDRYHVRVHDPRSHDSIEIELTPVTSASMLTGVTLSPTEKLSWFFAPRLLATGTAFVGGKRFELRQAVAYHDHNWGRFDWGGDYAWEWISVVHAEWSVTASRLLNLARTRVTSQFLQLENGTDRITFRDAEIQVVSHGRKRRADVPVVPGALRLITPSLLEDIPERMHWQARRGANQLDLELTPESIVRLVIPSERAVDDVVVLAEAVGAGTLDATLNGVPVQGRGHTIVELLR